MIETLTPPIHGAILDMDGVLWRGNQPIGDLPAIFARFDRLNIRIVLATNNATLSVAQHLEKLHRFGVTLEPWQAVNSGQAAAHLLHRRFPKGGPVYVVGESGVVTALEEYGFYPSDGDEILAVVGGLDRGITYQKLDRAAALARAGLPFIGTNPDKTFPMPGGNITPGAGAILAAIEAASGVVPMIAGKPAPALYELAMERLGCTPQDTISIGDRLDTDIAGAQAIGLRTALVLSGITTPEQAATWQPQPDLIAPDLATLLGM